LWYARATCMLAALLQVPVSGLYNSALARDVLILLNPPVTRMLPLGSSVAVCRARAMAMLPVCSHWFDAKETSLDRVVAELRPQASAAKIRQGPNRRNTRRKLLMRTVLRSNLMP